MKPDHVSHSQLTSYLRCSKAYYLSRVAKVPRLPSVWLVAGKALHTAIEQANRADDLSSFDAIATWRQAFAEAIADEITASGVPADEWRVGGRATKDKPHKENIEWWEIDGANQLASYVQWLRNSKYTIATVGGTLAVESETHATFGGIEVWGYCDAVYNTPQGELLIVDYKSGSKVPQPHQLALYAAAFKRNFDVDIHFGSFWMTRKGELTDPIDLSAYTPEYFDRQFSQLATALEAEIFIANPGDACYVCDVKSSCFAAKGSDAWKYDPDHPQFQFKKEQ